MADLHHLSACAGRWKGMNRLQDPHTNAPEDTEAALCVVPVIGGQFVRLDYTWSYQGKPQEGSILFGSLANEGKITAHWIDSWHMGSKVMSCEGSWSPGGEISVRGSYAAPPGPDWGWRIDVHAKKGSALRIVMHNIWPDGREDFAVESTYKPSG